ncbi:hypothetical protein [Halocatena pleomorpha]|uniref:Uncharacterized protein n=1 Tax=Halocatena pleomorpha TaxID=1785090 RepID=A0A3P3RGN8_9EURY|nr:hypothetical protein [Halocatena pleomorpha]RRJ32059.1 hypothetical protein EIK79_05900 [Halocatena pleomorpha]
MTVSDIRRIFVGRSVVVVFALLVGPLAIGVIDNDFMTPLALPGYVALSLGSSIGNQLFPNFALWVYWVPFLMGSYAVSVVIGGMYRYVRQ